MNQLHLFPGRGKTALPVVVISLLIFILAACSATGKFKHQYNPEGIPKDIKQAGYVLLVLKEEGKYSGVQNRGVNTQMRRHYGAAYEMVSKDDLDDPKYSDTNKYRYLLSRNSNLHHFSLRTTTSGNTVSDEYRDEIIHDRKLDKSLPSIGYASASYSLGIKAFSNFMHKK